ncbi:MAG: glycoside hydrolase family 29 [Lentisphaerae bacterium]|nr:MAG: glycoside hydrolase family 29 [Lentisphaerota bacterium]
MTKKIEASWQSLAQNYRPPQWFVDGKFGIWMHWGIPSAIDENRPNDGSHYGRRMYGTENYWSPNNNPNDLKMTEALTRWHTQRYGHPSQFGYEKFIPMWKAERWDPDALTAYFKQCGARFMMPVAVHHDNFDLYDSSFPWNSVKMGPHRDIIGEWKAAARKYGLKFGVSTHLYWSPRFFITARKYQKPGTLEWLLFNMDYEPLTFDRQDSWNQHWYERCLELIEKYEPDMFNNDSPYPTDEHGKGLGIKLFTEFLNRDLQRNNGQQTTVLSFKDPDVDKAAFTYNFERGMFAEIQPHPWIWATDLSGSWFYRKGSLTRMPLPTLIGNAVDVISKNGIVMLNIALRGDGTLPEEQKRILDEFAYWFRFHQEAIYGTRPWLIHGEGPLQFETRRCGENTAEYSPRDIRFTCKENRLYAFVLAPPTGEVAIHTLHRGGKLKQAIQRITLLNSDYTPHWEQTDSALLIRPPDSSLERYTLTFRIDLEGPAT